MLLLPPFMVGDTATLYGPRAFTCTVTAPGGAVFLHDDPYSKRINIPLYEAGVWTYEWPDGTTGKIIVLEPEKPLVAP